MAHSKSTIVGALAAVCLAAVAVPAVAQEVSRVSPPAVQLSGLDTRWVAVLAAEGDASAESAAFEALLVAKAELGILEMPAHAAVLLRSADVAERAGQEARAELLRDRATALAPGAALPHFVRAGAAWREAPWSLRAIASEVVAGYARLDRSLAGRAAQGMLWRELLAWFGALFSTLFALAMVVRHGSRVSHDLRLALLRTLTLGQAGAIFVLAVAAPALILASPFGFVLCALAAVSLHVSLRERLVGVLTLGMLVLAPGLTGEYAALVAANRSGASRVVSAVVGPCDDRCTSLLETAHVRDGDANAAVARAWTLYKRGTPDQRRRAEPILEGLTLTRGAEASAEVLRGNIAFAAGDFDAAERHYLNSHGAAVNRTQRAAALYALYRVHAFEARREMAQEALAGALSEDEALVSELAYYDGRSQNRLLPVSPIPASVIADEIVEATDGVEVRRAADELLSPWYGAVPPRVTTPASAAVALLLLLGALASRSRLVSTRCERCATPVSRFVLEPAYDADRCVLCFQLEEARDELSAEQIDAREARVERWEAAAPNLSLAANIAAPGWGLVVSGWALRGAAVLAAFCAALALLLAASPAEQLPYCLGGIRVFDGHGIVAAGVLVVAYPLSLWWSSRAVASPGGDEA